MFEALYVVFIAPIELAMRLVLDAGYDTTQSYGMAIALLVLCVNFTLLPVRHVAQRWRNADLAHKAKLAPVSAEIHAVYQGHERHLMLKTLYRQNNYHPVMRIKGSLGLLLQIPFFVAAFHLLNTHAGLDGAHFGPFADLGESDGLLSIATLQVNVMPLVMALVSVGVAYIGNREWSTGERIQAFALAGLFLVLLYQSPVALVFYWTLNLLLQALRTGGADIQADPAAHRAPSERSAGAPQSKVPAADRKQTPTDNSMSWTTFGQGLMRPLCIGLLLVTLGRRLFPIDAWLTPLYYCFLATLCLYAATAFAGFIRSYRPRTLDLSKAVALSFIALALGDVVIELTLVVLESAYGMDLLERLMLGLLLSYAIASLKLETLHAQTSNLRHAIAPAALLALQLLLFNPLNVYVTAPARLGVLGPDEITVWYSTSLCAFLVLWVTVVFLGRWYLSLLVWLALVVFFYGYLIDVDFGVFRGDRFGDEMRIYTLAERFRLLELSVLVMSWWLTAKVVTVKPMACTVFISVVLAFFVVQTSVALPALFAANQTSAVTPIAANQASVVTPFEFSRSEKNIVLIVPDATPGFILPGLMQEPGRSGQLEGFVHFKNAVSVGNFTASSTAALLAGSRYSPTEVNRRQDRTLMENIVEAYRWLNQTLASNGYATSFIDLSWISCAQLPKADFCANSREYRASLYDHYKFRPGFAFDTDTLRYFSVFKALPIFLKPFLYDSRGWDRGIRGPMQLAANINNRYHKYLLLDSLPRLSRIAQEQERPRFHHLWTHVNIAPFILGPECAPLAPARQSIYSLESRRNSVRCLLNALDNWFSWMKVQGVYANTKIIIAADHGAWDYGTNWYKGAVNPLFLVKDFGATGSLRVSNAIVQNSDTARIICAELEKCAGLEIELEPFDAPGRIARYHITTHGNRDFLEASKQFELSRVIDVNVPPREHPAFADVLGQFP